MRGALLCAVALTAFAASNPSDELHQTIRANDLVRLKQLISKPENVNLKDRHGVTPLMYAAAVGSVDAMKMLLAAGADAKAKNAFDATALMWGVVNPEKVRLLLDAGADVNARSRQGMTPLLIAASNAGSMEIVRLLAAKGADVKAASGSNMTALVAAANANDLDMVRLFVEKGVDVNQADKLGHTALQFAAAAGNLPMVRLLLAKGADVNAAVTDSLQVRKGPIALNHLTPLMFAAPYGSPEVVRTLLDAGAKVNARDIRDMTPLMLAVSSETQNPEVVRLLLDRGADVKAKSVLGETALDWARKFGNPPVIALLQGSGAQAVADVELPPGTVPEADKRTSMERSVALIQRTTTEFFKESGCVGCHHQNFTAMAVNAARKAGVPVDEAAAEEQLKVVKTQWMGAQEVLLQRLDPPGGADTLTYSLLGLAAAGYPADAVTDAMVVNLAGEQTPDGSWCYLNVPRAPIEEGCIGRAALGLRVLQLYGPAGLKAELDRRVARARDYLLEAQPRTTDDRAMRLLGLKWSGAKAKKVESAARDLLQTQRRDGGWAGNPYLESDAYSTGEALYALHESGATAAGDPAYQRGLRFLSHTQQPDGSWHVKSRAVKFQPYFQSGFPYDHDQWISAAATSWATVALANAVTAGETRAAK